MTLSFEFFPPKSAEGIQQLEKTALLLKEYSPDFCSVTFGAGGSTREGTLAMVKLLQQKIGCAIAPHLSSIGLTRKAIVDLLQTYQAMGIKRMVAIRGDLPEVTHPAGELRFANELITLIRETTQDHFHLYVAAYTECHPEALHAGYDLDHFKRKIEAGANSAITQYFFNPESYFYFREECIKQGISIPLIPGIMPITDFNKLVRFSKSCGAEIPRWIYKRLEAYSDNLESLEAFGIEIVYTLCERLLKNGAPGLHFYTLNQAKATRQLLNMLTFNKQLEPVSLP